MLFYLVFYIINCLKPDYPLPKELKIILMYVPEIFTSNVNFCESEHISYKTFHKTFTKSL